MIDPVTALGVATTAFNAIKTGFQAGRDVEGMAGDLSRWMGAVSDIKKAEELNQKPPLFKKLFAAGSVEEEALQTLMAKKKTEGNLRQRREDPKNQRVDWNRFSRHCNHRVCFLSVLSISIHQRLHLSVRRNRVFH